MSVRGFERLLLLLFVASGFAGLIYQSIWSSYLGLLLGHAAYAQTLVLAMFMGGMAIGASLVSRRSSDWRDLILAYALVEALIGVLGLGFHGFFVAYQNYTYHTVLPALASPGAVDAYLWITAALVIAPQTILLGATFPLMSAGYLRVVPSDDSRILGGSTSVTASAPRSARWLRRLSCCPLSECQGQCSSAGLINLLVALIAWGASKKMPAIASPSSGSGAQSGRFSPESVGRALPRLLLVAAAITGATSFVYEIGWVRLLNQAVGSSLHSFELMLSAFILGLALGGYWVRARAAGVPNVLRYAGWAQILMGMAALVSLPVFVNSFTWVGWLRGALQQTDSGYVLMSVGGSVIAMAVMLPAAFFAGMTLPLLTTALLRSGSGEAGIGRVYAANTFGAIVGVFLTVHILVPLVGVQSAITLAAIVDILLGLVLITWGLQRASKLEMAALAAAACLTLAVSLQFGTPDPRSRAAGAFRTGLVRYSDNVSVDFLRDGKTSTISVVTDSGSSRVIATNGKSDAGLTMSDAVPSADEVTMVLAGSLPILLKHDLKRIAFIGWGSGLSTHTVLGSKGPEVVETIEIEPAMYEGAKHFGARVARAYTDPRSHVRFNDARTHFARTGNRYDVIVSEPSNPWVAGVASLFTQEFYRTISPHLEEGGIFVQWLHTYEINDELFATMVAALLAEFPNVDTYMSTAGDLIFAATKTQGSPITWEGVDTPELHSEMSRLGLATPADWQLRKIGNTETLQAFVGMMRARPHSDFFPTVAHNAPRAMFKGERSNALRLLVESGMPVLDVLIGREPPAASESFRRHQDSALAELTLRADDVLQSMRMGRPIPRLVAEASSLSGSLAYLQQHVAVTLKEAEFALWMSSLSDIAITTLGFLPARSHDSLWNVEQLGPDPLGSPPEALHALAAYRGLAARDYEAAAKDARLVLDSKRADIPVATREQMYLILQLDAASRHSFEEILQFEEGIGRSTSGVAATGIDSAICHCLGAPEVGSPGLVGAGRTRRQNGLSLQRGVGVHFQSGACAIEAPGCPALTWDSAGMPPYELQFLVVRRVFPDRVRDIGALAPLFDDAQVAAIAGQLVLLWHLELAITSG